MRPKVETRAGSAGRPRLTLALLVTVALGFYAATILHLGHVL